MRVFLFCVFLYIRAAECKLWHKGIVHYAINNKDYDPHSQDVIVSTLERIEREVCVKFFNTPLSNNVSEHKILYINNPDKRKNCPPEQYDFKKSVVDMHIGYKCLNQRDISRVVVDMLRASIQNPSKPNSNDLLRKFQEQTNDPNDSTLLTSRDRNYINGNYHYECGEQAATRVEARRVINDVLEIAPVSEQYYQSKLWPLGIVMYSVEDNLEDSTEFKELQRAMAEIELNSCVVFQLVSAVDTLQPNNKIVFGLQGEDAPPLGFTKEEMPKISLPQMIHGAPGHSAHTLNLLFRILGIPMMSNRYDRDTYVTVNWKNVEKTKERFLERLPKDAWLQNTDGDVAIYDFESVTHAPVNYMCKNCSMGQQTVTPNEDHLWQRSMTMGHRTDLSIGDIALLNLLYSKECIRRSVNISK